MNTAWVVGIIVILVVLIGGAWYITQQTTLDKPVPNQVPISDQQAELLPTLPAQSPALESAAPAVETTVLTSVGTYKEGSGTATRSFDGTTFTHTVTATLEEAAPGKFYEGWLVRKTASDFQFFSTGKLTKQGEHYELSFRAPQNYLDHEDVTITEETLAAGLDEKPEAHVLEGSFK